MSPSEAARAVAIDRASAKELAALLARDSSPARPRPERSYPGACAGKEVARSTVYGHFNTAPRDGWGVFLSGPEPTGDLAACRSIGWSGERLLAVDVISSPGLWAVPERYPGAQVHCGDIIEALARVDRLSWFFADFMGLNRRGLAAVTAAARRLLPGGVIAYTAHRGREHGTSAPAIAARAGVDRRDGFDRVVRAAALLADVELEMADAFDYRRSGGIAMSVGVWTLRN